MNHGVSAYVCAALALVGLPGFASAAKSDFACLLRIQSGLASLPGDQLATKEAECRKNTAAYLRYLRTKTFASLAFVLSAIAVALVLFVFPTNGVSPTRQHVFAIGSVACFAWGTLGRLGWTERSYKGVTVFEELDSALFWALYWFGTMFGVASLVNVAA